RDLEDGVMTFMMTLDLLVILFMLFLFTIYFLSDTTICSSIPMYDLAISFTIEFFYTVLN
ncbi:MAG TPA: hypothetical protein VFP49_10080, partial [Nitrososphaeraceae archaeon]|nr:hypothetical protein [Nitrososphaeraceae archaeon]